MYHESIYAILIIILGVSEIVLNKKLANFFGKRIKDNDEKTSIGSLRLPVMMGMGYRPGSGEEGRVKMFRRAFKLTGISLVLIGLVFLVFLQL